jgi:YHS domain-containing protein
VRSSYAVDRLQKEPDVSTLDPEPQGCRHNGLPFGGTQEFPRGFLQSIRWCRMVLRRVCAGICRCSMTAVPTSSHHRRGRKIDRLAAWRSQVMIDDATYFFASEEHRKMFAADPERYTPQFDGFCALNVSMGNKVEPDPELVEPGCSPQGGNLCLD